MGIEYPQLLFSENVLNIISDKLVSHTTFAEVAI